MKNTQSLREKRLAQSKQKMADYSTRSGVPSDFKISVKSANQGVRATVVKPRPFHLLFSDFARDANSYN